MKILEVESLQMELQSMLEKLELQKEEVEKIHNDVMGIVNLEDSLKGQGGQAIRAFYQDCHIPFLTYYQSMLDEFKNTLNGMKSALQSVEPSSSGYINESFLQNDLPRALDNARRMTTDLANETNQVLYSVSDIVSLPNLREDGFVDQVRMSEKDIDQTLEKLHVFDQEQTRKLDAVSESSQVATGYIEQINSMFTAKKISISGYESGTLLEKLADEAIMSGIDGSGGSSGTALNRNSISERALNLLLSHESNLNADVPDTEGQDESKSLFHAIKDGAFESLAPLAVLVAAHKSKLLRIEYTKKKNHYTFKYNRKLMHFLKGKIGPDWTKKLIQKFNKTSKSYRNIEKTLKAQKASVLKGKEFKDPRTASQKVKGGVWKLATQNRPLHENVKNKIVKHSSREMVIPKEAFKKVAAKASGVGAAIVGTYSAVTSISDRWSEGDGLQGKEKYNVRGRVVAEEVNKVAGNVTGAAVGAYAGAAIGGLLSGPFAPFGAAAGAVIGSAIGATVGEWASKYTNKWASDAGAAVGEKIHDVKEKAKDALDGAKDALSDAKDSLFGWMG
ncbi:ribonuclease YeeF family protein [Sutcliffiella horikoshii]|uniref:ribonuclease YeeF family protein n=1 Tax=Sutcliffiella horikoshii TaxID=79883 RepID=UPI001CFE9B61|nr:LXG domain-containing protein [Sutcliffiella horikoshii]